MIVTTLKLQNFRSYLKSAFEFSPGITLITGANTSGKTNLLEAIYLLATGKSFRADQDREVIRWGEEIARIKSQITEHLPAQAGNGKINTELEIIITGGVVQGKKAPLKKYLVNGIPRRQLDFIGNLRIALFWPEDLELVTDSPSIRRKYLDSVLVQADREYRRNLLSYERGLRQRNKLLDNINQGNASRSQLLFWDQLMIKAGGYLTYQRANYIDFINQNQRLNLKYHIEYAKSVISESRLEQYKEAEVAAKATLVGPHRDDFIINKAVSLDLSKYGSRGEQRLAILWLKLAELDFFQKMTQTKPILLLDDIFSELDEAHRELVWSVVREQQTIIASADPHVAPRSLQKIITTIGL